MLYTLQNSSGMTACVSELGAHLTSVTLDDNEGKPVELTLGHGDFSGWCDNPAYLGATCGRFGNRIAHGNFQLEGQQFTLETNNSPGDIPCHLHGGLDGFNRRLWSSTPLAEDGRQGVRFQLRSPDGDQGYPGTLELSVTYWLNDNNELCWLAQATTDRATPVNIINHTYWNLSGDPTQPITDHLLQLHADHFLPTNPGMIPTGEIRNVEGTPMDFTSTKSIGRDIDSDYEPLQTGAGYDHCFVVGAHDGSLKTIAHVSHPGSGRSLELLSNQAGVQFYTGNFLDGSAHDSDGRPFDRRSGFCLETESFPDSPNHPNFPSCILHPGETYQHEMLIRLR